MDYRGWFTSWACAAAAALQGGSGQPRVIRRTVAAAEAGSLARRERLRLVRFRLNEETPVNDSLEWLRVLSTFNATLF